MRGELQLSIHPRHWPGGDGIKRNTAKPHKGKGKLAKKMKRLHERRLAHSATLKSLPSGQNPAAYKTPGSMNEHKR